MRQALRPYQIRAIEQVRELIRNGSRRILIVAPTGAGKTTVASEIIHGSVLKGSSSMFLAHRKELIEQCSKRLDEWSVNHGVIMANHPRWQPKRLTQVASIDTLRNRMRAKRWDANAKLIIIDEAHRSTAPSYLEVVDNHPEETVVLGLTATPCRMNGKGLGQIYEEMVIVAQPGELVKEGFLMEPTIYAPESPDLAGVHTVDGDFNVKELQIAVDKPALIGGVVKHLQKIVGPGKRTVLFAAGVGHSIHLRDQLRREGIKAEHVDGETHKEERDRCLAAIRSGEIEVLTNVGILTEGWDLPSLDCVVLARPTKSVSLYLQMVGRVIRPSPGKERAIVLDHAGNVDRHGWPTCDRDWELQTGESKKRPPPLKNCPKCGFVMPASERKCAGMIETETGEIKECGMIFVVESEEREDPEELEGELQIRKPPDPQLMADFLFESIARAKRFDMRVDADGFPGWASHRFKEKFFRWPNKQEKRKALERYHGETF